MDNVVVIEAGRSERHYWLDLWRYRELVLGARPAGPVGPLQANSHRRIVGADSPFPHDVGIHHCFWADC